MDDIDSIVGTTGIEDGPSIDIGKVLLEDMFEIVTGIFDDHGEVDQVIVEDIIIFWGDEEMEIVIEVGEEGRRDGEEERRFKPGETERRGRGGD